MPRINKIEKVCKLCRNKFLTLNRLAQYCSNVCVWKDGKNRRKGVTLKCLGCGKEFYTSHCHSLRRKYCSHECLGKSMVKGDMRVCKKCGKEYYRPPSQVFWRGSGYCSIKCSNFGRRMKKPQIDSMDKLWGKGVKERAKNACEYCGKTTTLNSHHLFSRSNRTTRHDLDNGVCLCVAHHIFGNFSAHKSPIEFVEWIKEKRGEEWYERLRLKAKSINTKTEEELVEELRSSLDSA